MVAGLALAPTIVRIMRKEVVSVKTDEEED
jgi:hypothetical protein